MMRNIRDLMGSGRDLKSQPPEAEVIQDSIVIYTQPAAGGVTRKESPYHIPDRPKHTEENPLALSQTASCGKPAPTESPQRLHHQQVGTEYHHQKFQETYASSLERLKRDHSIELEALRVQHRREMKRLEEMLLDQATTERLHHSKMYTALQSEHTRTLKDIAALRDQVKLSEEMEPGQVVSKFDDIRAAVDDICYEIVDGVGTMVGIADISRLTTLQIQADRESLQCVSAGPPPSLWQSRTGEGRPLDEFLEHSLRVIIISHLHEKVFVGFHPLLNREQSKTIGEIYVEIRKREPQMVSGTVRANIFEAIERLAPADSKEKLADQFVQAVHKDWIETLACVFRCNNGSMSDPHVNTLRNIYFKAYAWNCIVKSDSISLDYQPCIAPDDAGFDDQTMNCLIKGDVKPVRIICTLALGLKSSQAVGNGRDLEVVWQEKIRVLSDLYFRHG